MTSFDNLLTELKEAHETALNEQTSVSDKKYTEADLDKGIDDAIFWYSERFHDQEEQLRVSKEIIGQLSTSITEHQFTILKLKGREAAYNEVVEAAILKLQQGISQIEDTLKQVGTPKGNETLHDLNVIVELLKNQLYLG